MSRPTLSVGGIFRQHGAAYRQAHPLPLAHLRAMRAIEVCRTAALGGHVAQCDHCAQKQFHYHSCRNRHCPQCGSLQRARWLAQREAELLPVPYFHVVFTLPEQIAQLGLRNQKAIYDLLFQISSQTLLTIARDPQHLGATLGFFGILHTWGQNLLFHPHVHYVIAGGGIGPDDDRWIACRPHFFLPVKVLSRYFRNHFLAALETAFQQGKLTFPGKLQHLEEPAAFHAYLDPLRQTEWIVYAKPPFGGPAQVLEYLGRYTHRVAISNERLLSRAQGRVTFRWKDYRRKGRAKNKTMTLDETEFIRRFLLHILPPGLPRIRYYGFLASRHRHHKLAALRHWLAVEITDLLPLPLDHVTLLAQLTGQDPTLCPHCRQGHLRCIEILSPLRWCPSLDSS
jgi:hypothetical protein